MALYRGQRIPDQNFVTKLKKVDVNLYPVFDDLSLRWDILYKNPNSREVFNVYRVCIRDDKGKDVGFLPLDDRVINKLMRMDMNRRNIGAKQIVEKVRQAEDIKEALLEHNTNETIDYIFKHEHRTLEKARDALRGVYRRF